MTKFFVIFFSVYFLGKNITRQRAHLKKMAWWKFLQNFESQIHKHLLFSFNHNSMISPYRMGRLVNNINLFLCLKFPNLHKCPKIEFLYKLKCPILKYLSSYSFIPCSLLCLNVTTIFYVSSKIPQFTLEINCWYSCFLYFSQNLGKSYFWETHNLNRLK